MRSSYQTAFVDRTGRPLASRIQSVLQQLLPRAQSRFRPFCDESLVAAILEEAGNRISDLENAAGPVKNLGAYAWTTVINVARSRFRHSSMRMVKQTMQLSEGATALRGMRASFGTAEQIETRILLDELMALLSPGERQLCVLKQLGFSSREIARERKLSVAQVDTAFYRIKRKLRGPSRDPRGRTSPQVIDTRHRRAV